MMRLWLQEQEEPVKRRKRVMSRGQISKFDENGARSCQIFKFVRIFTKIHGYLAKSCPNIVLAGIFRIIHGHLAKSHQIMM